MEKAGEIQTVNKIRAKTKRCAKETDVIRRNFGGSCVVMNG